MTAEIHNAAFRELRLRRRVGELAPSASEIAAAALELDRTGPIVRFLRTVRAVDGWMRRHEAQRLFDAHPDLPVGERLRLAAARVRVDVRTVRRWVRGR